MNLKQSRKLAILRNNQLVNFNHENLSRVPTTSGYYEFLHNGKVIYVGVSNKGKYGNLKIRLQSDIEKDNFKHTEHYSKKDFREYLSKYQGGIKFRIHQMPIDQARINEKRIKQHTKFNDDNPTAMKKRVN